jgi:hypothetical protein
MVSTPVSRSTSAQVKPCSSDFRAPESSARKQKAAICGLAVFAASITRRASTADQQCTCAATMSLRQPANKLAGASFPTIGTNVPGLGRQPVRACVTLAARGARTAHIYRAAASGRIYNPRIMVATAHSRVKGLVTVAILKSNYDAKRDHVEMFEPFLIDTLCSLGAC